MVWPSGSEQVTEKNNFSVLESPWKPPLLPVLPGALGQFSVALLGLTHHFHLPHEARSLQTLHSTRTGVILAAIFITLLSLPAYLHFMKTDQDTLLIIDSLGIQITSTYASDKVPSLERWARWIMMSLIRLLCAEGDLLLLHLLLLSVRCCIPAILPNWRVGATRIV